MTLTVVVVVAPEVNNMDGGDNVLAVGDKNGTKQSTRMHIQYTQLPSMGSMGNHSGIHALYYLDMQ